jgi:thiosulfate dehydrogenase [quinone] large subunit
MNAMVWVRILVGVVWLSGAIEKLLNPEFPQQFAQSLEAGGFVSQAPPFFQGFMETTVIPNVAIFAQHMRAGQLALGIALILGLLTNLAALGSMALSITIMLSQGGIRLGTGLGAPELMSINVLVALIFIVILLSTHAKSVSPWTPYWRGAVRDSPRYSSTAHRGRETEPLPLRYTNASIHPTFGERLSENSLEGMSGR